MQFEASRALCRSDTTLTAEAWPGIRGALLTFGDHKGPALATMIELVAGAVIGDWTSAEAGDFDHGAQVITCRGELVLAFDPALIAGQDHVGQMDRAGPIFRSITVQGARLPSQRRCEDRPKSDRDSISVPPALLQEIHALLP